MVYAILRNSGVDVGKMDFLGAVNFVDAKPGDRLSGDGAAAAGGRGVSDPRTAKIGAMLDLDAECRIRLDNCASALKAEASIEAARMERHP